MKKTIVVCDNCGIETDESIAPMKVGARQYDVCDRCRGLEFVLEGAPPEWPKVVTRESVVDWLKHQDRIEAAKRTETKLKVSEINRKLEAEIINLPVHDPTRLIDEVKKLQNRVVRT